MRSSRTRLQQSASWPKPWVNRTIPRRASSPMGMRLTRPRSLSSKPKALSPRIAGIAGRQAAQKERKPFVQIWQTFAPTELQQVVLQLWNRMQLGAITKLNQTSIPNIPTIKRWSRPTLVGALPHAWPLRIMWNVLEQEPGHQAAG